MSTNEKNRTQDDVLLDLANATQPSPTLTVMRDMTKDRDTFKVSHQPMAAPLTPEHPKLVRAGKRRHVLHSLKDALGYMEAFKGQGAPAAFYTTEQVSIVMDESAEKEREIISVNLERHPAFSEWFNCLGREMSHDEFMTFIRSHRLEIGSANESSDFLIGTYASIRGELVHDSDEYMDEQHRAVTFTVSRRIRGGKENQAKVEDVPTEFAITVRILRDDAFPTSITLSVKMTGSTGNGVRFTLLADGLSSIVDRHIDSRIEEWVNLADFPAFNGVCAYEKWAEAEFPQSVRTLMHLQATMIAASKGVDPSD